MMTSISCKSRVKELVRFSLVFLSFVIGMSAMTLQWTKKSLHFWTLSQCKLYKIMLNLLSVIMVLRSCGGNVSPMKACGSEFDSQNPH